MGITEHYRKRGIKRGLFPGWLSAKSIDLYTKQRLELVRKQRVSKMTGLLINITPGATIVTDLKMKTAITVWKNKVEMVR